MEDWTTKRYVKVLFPSSTQSLGPVDFTSLAWHDAS